MYVLISRNTHASLLDARQSDIMQAVNILTIQMTDEHPKSPLYGILTEQQQKVVGMLCGITHYIDADVAVLSEHQGNGLGFILMLAYAIEYGTKNEWVLSVRNPEKLLRVLDYFKLTPLQTASDDRTYTRMAASPSEIEQWTGQRDELCRRMKVMLR